MLDFSPQTYLQVAQHGRYPTLFEAYGKWWVCFIDVRNL